MKSVSSVNDMKKHSSFTKIINLLKNPVWIPLRIKDRVCYRVNYSNITAREN